MRKTSNTLQILVGAQYCGGPAPTVINPLRAKLYAGIARFILTETTEVLEAIYLTLRVDGSFHEWHELGPKRLRFMKLKKDIGVDICLTQASWQVEPAEIRKTFIDLIDQGFQLIVERLAKEKVAIPLEQLKSEWQSVLAFYWADESISVVATSSLTLIP